MTLNIRIQKLIKSYIDSGLNVSEIYSRHNKNVSKDTVYRCYGRTTRDEISSKSHSWRPRNLRSKEFIVKIKRKVDLNKKRISAWKLAKEEVCLKSTFARVIH